MNYFEYCARQKALDLYTESEEDFTRYGYYTGKSNKTYHEFEASGKFTEEQLEAVKYCLDECLIDSAWIDHPEYSPEKIKAIGHCLMHDYECMYPAYTLTNPDLTAENIYDLYWFGYKRRIDKETAIALSKYSYTFAQMYEIYEGVEGVILHSDDWKDCWSVKVDISWYAHPDFHENQMMVLKDALVKGLGVSKAANPKFPYFIMKEIIEVTSTGGDTSIYDYYEFDNVDELNEIPMDHMFR